MGINLKCMIMSRSRHFQIWENMTKILREWRGLENREWWLMILLHAYEFTTTNRYPNWDGGPMYRNGYQPTTVHKLPYRGTFQTCTHTDMVFLDIVHSCSEHRRRRHTTHPLAWHHARMVANWIARRGVFQSWGTLYERCYQHFGDCPALSASIMCVWGYVIYYLANPDRRTWLPSSVSAFLHLCPLSPLS